MIPDPTSFLAAHGWHDARCTPFPADWSTRRYARVQRPEAPRHAILMQATPDAQFRSFVHIDHVLRGLGASAPLIYAIDNQQGLLLLEDFGDRNIGRLIDAGSPMQPWFERAVQTLVELQHRFAALPRPQDLPNYDTSHFLALLAPVLDNFSYPDPPAARQALSTVWTALLTQLELHPRSLMLRDFMVDNLMDLPERVGWQNLGVLDFELAGVGPIAYDLASLLEQVRRDLPDSLRLRIINLFSAAWPDYLRPDLEAAVAILAAHRHLRIFARLQAMPKPAFQARTLAYLQKLLLLPVLRPAQLWCQTYLPQSFR